MLAAGGKQECRDYTHRSGLPAYTENTITGLDELIHKTSEAKKNGFSYDDGEAEIGVGCIGVLVRNNNGDIAGGLSVSAPIDRRKKEWVETVKEAGKRLSESLEYFTQ